MADSDKKEDIGTRVFNAMTMMAASFVARKAITLANQHPGPDRIVFSMSPVHTITTNGATKWFSDVRTVWTAGDLPSRRSEVLIRPSRCPRVSASRSRC